MKALPEELLAKRRFLLWKKSPGAKRVKTRKTPFYASGEIRNGKLDTPEDLSKLVSFEEAESVYMLGGYAGIGFALGDGTGAFDLDYCLGEHGGGLVEGHAGYEIVREAKRRGAYIEVSPSGRGLRIIGPCQNEEAYSRDGLEYWGRGRFVTLTGNAWANAGGWVELNDLRATLPARTTRVDDETDHEGPIITPRTIDELRDALSAIDADERELWIRMGMALKTLPDEKGKSLWIDWSQKSKKFDAADTERVWESFNPTGSGYKAIFAEARDNWNWTNPASREVASNAIEGEVLEGAEVSEDAIALAFTARYRDTLRYDHDAGSWSEWDGGRWRRDGRQRAFHYAREASRMLGEGKRAMCKAIVATGVEKFAKAHPAHAVESGDWDRDPMLLGTPGGTVDLTTGELRTPDPKHLITKQTNATPDRGEPMLWLRFLNEALGGDAEAIRFLQRWAGYCLTGDTREHALLFLHGPGGTGKSVFLNTLARVLGDYAVTAPMETFTASKYERHPADLAMLRGARLVTASETEEGRHWAEAKIKQITGGDPITARFMRQNFFTYSPQFKLTIIGNHAPRLTSPDDAMRRRFNILGFNVKPSKPDSHLEEKLQPEHGRILQWAIEGCLDWEMLGGLACPDAVIKATEEYFQEQDLFGQWLEQACTQSSGRRESSKALYEDWAAFARHAGDDPGSQCSFSDRLKSRGFIRKKVGGVAYYQGLELKFEEDSNG
jgi:P4 family phage/plasmid primase-like protien